MRFPLAFATALSLLPSVGQASGTRPYIPDSLVASGRPVSNRRLQEFGGRVARGSAPPVTHLPGPTSLGLLPSAREGEPIAPVAEPRVATDIAGLIAPSPPPVALQVAPGREATYRRFAGALAQGAALMRVPARGVRSQTFIDAPLRSADKILADMAADPIQSAGLIGPRSGATLLKLASGNRAVFRRTLGDYNAYRADRLLELGFVPPTMLAALPGEAEAGSLQLFVDAEPAGVITGDGMATRPWQLGRLSRAQVADVQVFDVLTRNTVDRHGMNFGAGTHTRGGSRAVLWDHQGTRFDEVGDLDEVTGLARISAPLLGRLRTVTPEQVRAQLGPNVDGFLTRRDRIVKHFDSLIARYGRDAIVIPD